MVYRGAEQIFLHSLLTFRPFCTARNVSVNTMKADMALNFLVVATIIETGHLITFYVSGSLYSLAKF